MDLGVSFLKSLIRVLLFSRFLNETIKFRPLMSLFFPIQTVIFSFAYNSLPSVKESEFFIRYLIQKLRHRPICDFGIFHSINFIFFLT